MGNRILIAGVGPLPQSNTDRLYAPALRLWAMTHMLLQAGHHVLAVEAEFGSKPTAEEPPPTSVFPPDGSQPGPSAPAGRPKIARVDIRWQRANVPLDPDLAGQAFRELAAVFHPNALVTTSDVMALAAVRSRLPHPLYVDYFGDPLAERQAQGAVHDSDEALYNAWAYVLPVLLRADHFSTCSKPQRYALLGQLAAAGRLNRHTCGHNLVDALPQGLSYEKNMEPTGTFPLRGNVVPPDSVIVLSLGGYNTWLDERALFAAMEEAMSLHPAIHFVSTGGEIPGHNTVTFQRFKSYIDNSRMKNRFHFLGWIPTYQVADVCDQADIGINLDRFTHEAEFGLRNRLYMWMLNQAAVISTALSDEIRLFASRNLIRAVPVGNPHVVAEAILDLTKNPEVRKSMCQRAREFITKEYHFERLMRPLAEWAESPGLAPDRLAALGEATRTAAARRPSAHGDPAHPLTPDLEEEPVAVDNPLARAQSQFLDIESELTRMREAQAEAQAGREESRLAKFYKTIFKK